LEGKKKTGALAPAGSCQLSPARVRRGNASHGEKRGGHTFEEGGRRRNGGEGGPYYCQEKGVKSTQL